VKRVAIQGVKVDPSMGEPKYKRAFDVLVDANTGSVLLDIKEKRGYVRLSLDSLLEQIDKIMLAISENKSQANDQDKSTCYE